MSNSHSDFKSLTQAPHIAWPTVILFASAWIIYTSSIIAAEHHILPISAVVVINLETAVKIIHNAISLLKTSAYHEIKAYRDSPNG